MHKYYSTMQAKLPVQCPSCQNTLLVAQLSCNVCQTTVSGSFNLPVLLKLSDEEQHFVLQFILSSGSLKEMAQQMNISYPTIRNKLDDIIQKIKLFKEN